MPGGRNGVKYAEETLGVHSVHEEAKSLVHNIDTARGNLALKRRAKVQAEELYTDAELAFVADMRADNPDLSQTAFEKFIKGKIHQNPELRKQRGALADLNYDMDVLDREIKRLQNLLDITTARIGELGGYLHYLAELKAAETVTNAVPRDNWPPDSALP